MKTETYNDLTKIPYFEDFEFRLNAGETLNFDFNRTSGMSFWKSSDPQYINTPYVRSTVWYTPKTYETAAQAYRALKNFAKKYGLKNETN